MKNLIVALFVGLFLMASCSQNPRHEIQYSNNGQDSVVYVHYYDDNSHQWVDRYMEYMIFMNLYNMGGYNSVYGYYRTNPYDSYRYNRYRDYSYHYSPSYYRSNGYTKSGSTWTRPANYSSRPSYKSNSSSRPSNYSSRPSNSSSRPSSGYSSRPSSRPSSGYSSRPSSSRPSSSRGYSGRR